MKKLLPLVILGLLASCQTTPPTALSSALPDWSPDLTGPIQLIEEQLQESEAQQEMNYLATNLAELYDAQLWSIFQGRLDKLPAEARSEAVNEQHRWLAQREHAVTEAYEDFAGGSGAPLAGAMASIEMSQKRIASLLGEVP